MLWFSFFFHLLSDIRNVIFFIIWWIVLILISKYFSHEQFLFIFYRNYTGADTEELPTSYHILFENIDKTVDFGGYPNRFPVHLKYIAISGLPADEVPIIEVRDLQGLVFNSHQCLESSRPTWSSEYGDGSFQVSHDILGDFAITCRFGGSFAMVKDATTLIFTYQNNTGIEMFHIRFYCLYYSMLEWSLNLVNYHLCTTLSLCLCLYLFFFWFFSFFFSPYNSVSVPPSI